MKFQVPMLHTIPNTPRVPVVSVYVGGDGGGGRWRGREGVVVVVRGLAYPRGVWFPKIMNAPCNCALTAHLLVDKQNDERMRHF
jgi:hypothetical protein